MMGNGGGVRLYPIEQRAKDIKLLNTFLYDFFIECEKDHHYIK